MADNIAETKKYVRYSVNKKKHQRRGTTVYPRSFADADAIEKANRFIQGTGMAKLPHIARFCPPLPLAYTGYPVLNKHLNRSSLRYRTTRHGRYARFFAWIRILGIRSDSFGSPRSRLFDRFRVVVRRGPSRHLPRGRSYVKNATFALKVASFQLQHVELKKSSQKLRKI